MKEAIQVRNGAGFMHNCLKMPPFFQPKLIINQPNDVYEQEADTIADKVMGMTDNGSRNQSFFKPALSLIQRRCAHCQKEEQQLQRKETNHYSATADHQLDTYIGGLPGSGEPLVKEAKKFFEFRMGYDLSGVRIHNNSVANESAKNINALAYTHGNDIVFAANQFSPGSNKGKKLLAHELTHVVQQKNCGEKIMRFSDTGHHIIEEAALTGAGFSEKQMLGIEKGNVRRDYSQVGTIGNALLLCQPDDFGGYKQEEHFDNFIWDEVQNRWRTRGASPLSIEGTPVDLGPTPIEYISSELMAVSHLGLDPKDAGLLHLGNAFHTIEDFFAHSNFVELINEDFRFGKTLLTGDFGKADEAVSLTHVLESVSAPDMKEYYKSREDALLPQTGLLSHSRIAHDTPASHNYALARRLAALVIQHLGKEIIELFSQPELHRERLMNENVIPQVKRYLRPPLQTDQWWVSMQADDKGKIDKRLGEAERRTPVTVNQCMLSPLKNLEASANSNLHIPLGVALPINLLGSQTFLQAGGGTVTFSNPPGTGSGNNAGGAGTSVFAGAQITGTFDLF